MKVRPFKERVTVFTVNGINHYYFQDTRCVSFSYRGSLPFSIWWCEFVCILIQFKLRCLCIDLRFFVSSVVTDTSKDCRLSSKTMNCAARRMNTDWRGNNRFYGYFGVIKQCVCVCKSKGQVPARRPDMNGRRSDLGAHLHLGRAVASWRHYSRLFVLLAGHTSVRSQEAGIKWTALCSASIRVRAPDQWSKGCEFESRQERRNKFPLQSQLLFGVRSTPVLPQLHVKDHGRSVKSAGGRLHPNTHTPLT